MNKIMLIGNLTHDPEMRATSTGISVCTFSIAVSRRFAGPGGERQTDYFRINAWRQLGETCNRYLAKGRKVAVIGELQARTYQTKDGSTRVSLDVSADEIEFLTPRQQSDEGGYQPSNNSYQPAPRANTPAPDMSGFTDIDEDELPF